ncbi:hypothetical protein [Psychromonas hadalis]|uniref:hypothetical protein n=1 Tax=Psychromonas hadalis TaxID=211669 RepID=UPI0003B412CB|nr:hypothetical protein [Psychromonas hadalis]
MKVSFKVKLAHILENGDSIQFECFMEADNHNVAYEAAKLQFLQAIKGLSTETCIEIDKSKIAAGAY